METAYVPEFLQCASRMEVLRRVEVFMNLSVSFTSDVRDGKDSSIKTMKTLLQYQPLQGLTVLNDVINILKDVVLGFEHNKLTGKFATLLTPSNKLGDKQHTLTLFPKDVLNTACNMLNDLWGAIHSHKAILKKLKKAQKDFIVEHTTLNKLSSQCEEAKENHTDNLMEGKSKKKLKITKRILENLRKQHDKQKHKTMLSLARVLVINDQEKAIRFYKVKESQIAVKDLLEHKIYEALNIGYANLVEFAKNLSLPEHVNDDLKKFDAEDVAKTVYSQLCSRYIYPAIESFSPTVPLAACRFEKPKLPIQHKNEIRLGRSESCMDLLGESSSSSIVNGREELYVWACENRKDKSMPSMLAFTKGQKIKQKFCCSNGDMAFGWKRVLSTGQKIYGFYPTNIVQLVP